MNYPLLILSPSPFLRAPGALQELFPSMLFGRKGADPEPQSSGALLAAGSRVSTSARSSPSPWIPRERQLMAHTWWSAAWEPHLGPPLSGLCMVYVPSLAPAMVLQGTGGGGDSTPGGHRLPHWIVLRCGHPESP